MYLSETNQRITESGYKSCSTDLLPAGSVLLSSRAPIGYVAINIVPICTNQGFKNLIPISNLLHAEYLYFWLRANRIYLQSLGNGATFKEVSKATVERIEIPLPPLAEQKRIADLLDEADVLRRKRREALTKLDTLLQSIFLEMFSGHLAKQSPLRSVVKEFRYGTSIKSEEKGYPTLRIPNVINQSIDFSEIKNVPVSPEEFKRLKLLEGDLLFVRTNGNPDYVGRCAVFESESVRKKGYKPENFVYASYLIRARLDQERVHPRFVQFYLLTHAGRAALRSRCRTSAGQYNINTEGLGLIPIPIPPFRLQEEFASKVTEINSMRERYEISLSRQEILFSALQHRAFTIGGTSRLTTITPHTDAQSCLTLDF